MGEWQSNHQEGSLTSTHYRLDSLLCGQGSIRQTDVMVPEVRIVAYTDSNHPPLRSISQCSCWIITTKTCLVTLVELSACHGPVQDLIKPISCFCLCD